ncbi:MAG TPA: hypothetical protein VGX94_18865 [Terriglobia bacterium]|nr:hypothetical protein [Terriglobia bacterium]
MFGTVMFSWELDTNVTVGLWLPKLTVEPFVKPFPVIVTVVPRGPEVGLKLVITG